MASRQRLRKNASSPTSTYAGFSLRDSSSEKKRSAWLKARISRPPGYWPPGCARNRVTGDRPPENPPEKNWAGRWIFRTDREKDRKDFRTAPCRDGRSS